MDDQQKPEETLYHKTEHDSIREKETRSKELILGICIILAVILFANLYEPEPAKRYSDCWTELCREEMADKAAQQLMRTY